MQAEAKIKKYEEDLATIEDSNQKSSKEKKMMEERLSDVMATLAEEEEKAKHLGKLKAKHESTIGELEEKLRKDNQQRQEVERAKRKIETELNDLKEQVGEKKMHVSTFLLFFKFFSTSRGIMNFAHLGTFAALGQRVCFCCYTRKFYPKK